MVAETAKMLAVKKNFAAENHSFLPSRPLKRPFCVTLGEGVVSLVPPFASLGALWADSSPLVMQKVALMTPPPHLSCHKKAFSMVSNAKTTYFQRNFFFITLDFFSPLVMQKLALVTPPPSPLVPQKGPFNGREGQRDWSSAEKKFFTASIFSLYATNGIGIFFTLVNVFCHMLFFDFIGLGSYKNAACGLETRVKIFMHKYLFNRFSVLCI